MKLIFLMMILTMPLGIFAQNSGVYLNAADFRNGKLTYEIDCSTEKHKIKLNEFLDKSFITVVHKGQSYKLAKHEIFGYKDCNDKVYKFVNNDHYMVLNPNEEILIYKHEIPASKNQKAATHYYFSASVVEDVKELTLSNLKNAYPENHKFHDLLDAEFKSGDLLAAYDSFHKTYKINRLFANSK